MESLHKLEKTIAGWYGSVPHLPKNAQTWLADNIWWLVVVALVLSAIGTFWVAIGLLVLGAGLATAGGAIVTSELYGSGVVAAFSGIALISVLVVLLFMVLDLIIMSLAISPLKAHKKRGWDLLLILALLNALSVVISGLLTFNVFGIIWGLIWSAVGAYFLFEIRGYFGAAKKSAKPAAKKA